MMLNKSIAIKIIISIVFVILTSCASSKSTPKIAANTEIHNSLSHYNFISFDFYSTQAIMEIMQKSSIYYRFISEDYGKFQMNDFDLTAQANPDWYLQEDEERRYVLKAFQHNSCAVENILEALEFLQKKEFDKSYVKYEQAYKCDSANHKILTYMGNSLALSKQYDQALIYYKKSLELNPVDYQAHYFISDTYRALGENEKAKDHLIEAMMLNGRNMRILQYANNLLESVNEKINYKRLTFDFDVKKYQIGDSLKVDIYSNQDDFVASTCVATMFNDSEFDELRQMENYESQAKINCLLDHIKFQEMKLSQGKEISKRSQDLVEIKNRGLLQMMVWWEFHANQNPAIIYILPEAGKEKIRTYIRDYVIVPGSNINLNGVM